MDVSDVRIGITIGTLASSDGSSILTAELASVLILLLES